MHSIRVVRSLASVVVLALAARAVADEPAFFRVAVDDLQIVEGKIAAAEGQSLVQTDWRRLNIARPYVVLDGAGEAYWQDVNGAWFRPTMKDQWGRILVRLPEKGREVVGRFFFPQENYSAYDVVKFKIAADRASADYRNDFLTAKSAHYQRLLSQNVPGAAWFRHQVRVTQLEQKGSAEAAAVAGRTPVDTFRPITEFDDTYSLFAGSRAVSENLQLDRVLPAARADETTVTLDSIKGISVKEIDWKPLIAGKSPALDPLAAYVPADQHVVFFPTFADAVRLSDEADRQGTPLVQAAEPQSQDAGVVERYQRQVGLRTTALGRMLGPQVIDSVAMTGGDSYFRVGTDLAVLFEAKDLGALKTMLAGQITLNTANEKGVKQESGEIAGVGYQSWRNEERTVSSYLAAYGNAAVVTNSPAQLRRLIETHQGKTPAIGGLDEYRFFRDRYQLGQGGETAFLFLSDATIRRWCGPRWRIADSRRVRDLAVLAELQAANVPKLAAPSVESGPIYSDLRLSTNGELRLTNDGVRSSTLGSLAFMTPISELPLETVAKSEATAYERWRDGYQRNFSWAFDPIALRFHTADDLLTADLTIMPLIDNSDYRDFIAVSKGVKLKPSSGDPHGALFHAALAFNKDSDRVKQFGGMASGFMPQMKVDPLSWIGESISIYADESPLWGELLKQKTDREREKFARDQAYNFPAAVNIEVASAFKATAFLTALRAFIDTVGPGMTAWETKQHGEQAYVKISPTAKAVRRGEPEEKLAIYYALTSEALTISPSEDLIKRALDRQAARDAAADGKGGQATAADAKPEAAKAAAAAKAIEWLGENLCLEAGEGALQALAALSSDEYQAQMQRLAWGNLPILNEWRRMFPKEDAVELHERLWDVRLICPGGGKYEWNEKWQTYESTVYGSPGEPKSGPPVPPQLAAFQRARFGLTFEAEGLRARAELRRKP